MNTSQPENKEVILTYNQDTDDIIDAILTADQNNPTLSYENAIYFEGADDYQTGANIFYYLKENIKYEAEPDSEQTTKTIERLVADKKGDCKHYSLFAGAVLKSLNIPYAYRFVSFGDNEDIQHVYVVIHPETNPIYLDAVIDQFDTQERYNFAQDYYPESKKIQGIGATAPLPFTTIEQSEDLIADYWSNFNWASYVLDIYNADSINFLIEEKKSANKWLKIEPFTSTARAFAKRQVMNESDKYQPAVAFWLIDGLARYNQSVYNEIMSDYGINGVYFLYSWENIKREWYNIGGNKNTTGNNGLIAQLVNWGKMNVTFNKPFSNLTAAEIKPFIEGALNVDLDPVFTENDVDENAPELPTIAGNKNKSIGAITAAVVAIVTAIIGAIVGIIVAALNFKAVKIQVDTQTDLAAQSSQDAQELENAYISYVNALNETNDQIESDSEGNTNAFYSPLAIAGLFFGAVLYFENKL
jgi:hypothetical protein